MMQMKREIGTSGISATAVGLGTWAMGGWMWGGGDDAASIAAIRASLDAGITLIDTAPAYGLGRAEEIVGRAIAGRRDEVVLVTKCGLVWDTDEGRPFVEQDGKMIHRYLGARSVRDELEASLKRLGTDHVDVFITHWQDPTTPIAETMEALLALKAEGKTRAIGISNADPQDLAAYLAAGPVDCVQEAYNMLDRGLEKTLLPTCLDEGVSVISYSSLALGLLTGRINSDRVFGGDDLRRTNPRFSPDNLQRVSDFTALLEPMAQTRGVNVGEIVIAWTLAQPGITFSLCGARNAEQAAENARAGSLRLTAEELRLIDGAIAEHLGPVASAA
ncbi:aldo/keto reductase [Hoeflea sp. G2-23]|uniref:Aldo/keto reductase n=1 Tax=Hoeflea algicola TaxID=2983763 RepID=A0ABT3Z478_9HYPH|nr:aldo/keto reductase [Hoeflea algicola]MCY0146574.1 aldo/keto reductase [Hoeflea algicola]